MSIENCKKKVEAAQRELEAAQAELKKLTEIKPKHGDIVILVASWAGSSYGDKRYIMRVEGAFMAFDNYGKCCSEPSILEYYKNGDYKVIGNIFEWENV